LASGGKDNLVKLWDPKAGKALSTLQVFHPKERERERERIIMANGHTY
jgi:hypothetical protein